MFYFLNELYNSLHALDAASSSAYQALVGVGPARMFTLSTKGRFGFLFSFYWETYPRLGPKTTKKRGAHKHNGSKVGRQKSTHLMHGRWIDASLLRPNVLKEVWLARTMKICDHQWHPYFSVRKKGLKKRTWFAVLHLSIGNWAEYERHCSPEKHGKKADREGIKKWLCWSCCAKKNWQKAKQFLPAWRKWVFSCKRENK